MAMYEWNNKFEWALKEMIKEQKRAREPDPEEEENEAKKAKWNAENKDMCKEEPQRADGEDARDQEETTATDRSAR